MMKDIGFISIGQAGANIGKLFEKAGFDVFFVNTSTEDLGMLQQSAHKFHLKGGEGCNKDRTKAKRLLARNLDSVISAAKERIKQDMVFLIFSSGGGTGSGIGPTLVELLQEEGKKCGVITVIPSEKESIKAHINSYECAKELSNIYEMGATFFLDNNSGEDILKINDEFVTLFKKFIHIPIAHKSNKGNIDKAEIKEVLNTKGAAILTSIKDTSNAKLIESFNKNIFAPMEKDRVIKYIALSVAGAVDLEAIQKEVGLAYDTFQTYNGESTLACLAGITYPFNRLVTIRDKVKTNKEQISNSLEAVHASKLTDNLDIFSTPRKPDVQKKSSRDALKKFL